MTYHELRTFAARLAGEKWRLEDTIREEQSHLREWREMGEAKNLLDAAICVAIREQIAAHRFVCLIQKYQEVTGKEAGDGLEERMKKFLQYEDVPFPPDKSGPPAEPWKVEKL